MASGGHNTQPIAPTSIIIPTETPASTQANAMSGALVMSGAKLYVKGASDWELVTSA